ncbi:DUF1064 domain-containing protein [Sphingobium chungbukense]|uniref:Uncharacterized protein n=1 Tax=Sphingobium chungbukense TaxID=56193 RepID=A0A0M3ARY6_9SPHN|nr:DUF1064 domain-containing protein [Sphingobium chungbukense]KKW92663.1 hypothetical protein YP76_06935 [Sphingobium chungbukense]
MTKYRAIKTDCDHGHTHDSRKEAARCNQLHDMEIDGAITDLRQQPSFAVNIGDSYICTYVADFEYRVQDCRIVEDVKGVRTAVFQLKRKLVEATHPGVVVTIYPPVRRKRRKAKKVAT